MVNRLVVIRMSRKEKYQLISIENLKTGLCAIIHFQNGEEIKFDMLIRMTIHHLSFSVNRSDLPELY